MYKKYKVQVHVYDRYTQSTHLWAGVGRGFSPPLLCPPELSSEQQENCHFYPPSLFPPHLPYPFPLSQSSPSMLPLSPPFHRTALQFPPPFSLYLTLQSSPSAPKILQVNFMFKLLPNLSLPKCLSGPKKQYFLSILFTPLPVDQQTDGCG